MKKIIFGFLIIKLFFMIPFTFAAEPGVGDIVLMTYATNMGCLGGYWSGYYVVLTPLEPPQSRIIDSIIYRGDCGANPLVVPYLPAFVLAGNVMRYYYPTGSATFAWIQYVSTPTTEDPTWPPPPDLCEGDSCYSSAPQDIEQGAPYDACPTKLTNFVGNPVNILNGNKYEPVTDLILPTPNKRGIAFKRYYNSQTTDTDILGYGWTHSYSVNLTPDVILDSISHIRIEDNTGKGHYFKNSSGSRWDGVFKDKSYVIVEIDETYIWHKIDGTKYGFNSQGQLSWMDDAVGNRQNFSYDGNNRLETVTDNASGRVLTFHYNANDLIDYIEGPVTTAVTDGTWVTYGYDGNNNLTSVTYADGSGFNYEYSDPNDFHNLTAKKDKLNHILSTWAYDTQDRGISNFTRDGKGVTINYDNYETNSTIDVTDAYNVTRTYTVTQYDTHFPRVTSILGPGGCTSCAGELPIRYEYDPVTLNVIEEEYANGTVNQYQDYDEHGNPGTVILAVGTPEQRTTTYTYHPQTSEKMSETEASVLGAGDKETIWDFDDPNAAGDTVTPNENPTSLVYRLIEKGFTKNDAGSVIAYEYITTYTYNARGQLESVDGPLPDTADTTSYGYDQATGDLRSITQPLVGVTTFANYDGAGNPGNMIDVNNQITTFTYDGENRLLSSTINGRQNSRSFNIAGDLETVTDSGSRALTYAYDPVYGRLERITDMQNNYLFYDYDTQGNPIEDSAFDSSNIRKRWSRFDYQNPAKPGLLWKIINPDDTATVFTYNSMNDMETVTNPRTSHATTYYYDPLKRLKQVIQPGTVTTNYGYDAQGNLDNVTDAAAKPTDYVYDDLGRVLSEVSPDSGTTISFYDLVNNQIRTTDANSITVIYSFDALGRLTNVSYPDPAQNTTFSYDQGPNGMGRLTGIFDAGGTTGYIYNTLGQLTDEIRANAGAPSAMITYGYNPTSADLESITYPSGLVVMYQQDTNGRIEAIYADGANVLRSIKYMPFGPVEDVVLGNNILTLDRTYNDRYLVDRIKVGNMDYQYQHYADGSVSNVASVIPLALASGSTDYTYILNTNRIDTTTGQHQVQYSYDSYGNIIYDGIRTFIYNQDNRLVEVKEGTTTIAVYSYDGYGRRVKKVTGGVITYYHYDADGKLIAEIAVDGTPLRDYIYLDSEPVAMKIYGAQAGIYYFLNDHLGTPQKIVDSSGALVWEAAYLPFGQAQVMIATITNNLRFPGQYYEEETGLHYNWHRYYDPATGRYLTPDPIGLAGGINLYAYVQNDPVNFVDPMGLYWFRQDWQSPGVVGRPGTPVPPRGTVSELIEQHVPAGYTFGELHDTFVDIATSAGLPDWLVNIPSMPSVYNIALTVEMLRSLGILEQPSLPEQATPCGGRGASGSW
jgi:RHS repeat-associated protein